VIAKRSITNLRDHHHVVLTKGKDTREFSPSSPVFIVNTKKEQGPNPGALQHWIPQLSLEIL